MTSALYLGQVRHRRFSPKDHAFEYPLYMAWLDVGCIEVDGIHPLLGTRSYHLLRFCQSDYLPHQSGTLMQRACREIERLGVCEKFDKVFMLCQLRCFGIYFSPVNFYFYQRSDGEYPYMVAEVSNTPWNERHSYLIALGKKVNHPKAFNVSPFMEMQMDYHWRVKVPQKVAMIHIENHKNGERVFDATLTMTRQPLDRQGVSRLLLRFPAMTLSIVKGIYWQALKLALKGVPFLGYQKT